MDITYYKKYEPIFGSWHIVRELGEGSFGRVFEIERKDFGRTYKAALKAITIPRSQSEVKSAMAEGLDEDSVSSYFREIVQDMVDEFALMSKLKGHSNIVSYEDHTVIPHEGGLGWDILIRMELLTPLLDYTKNRPMDEATVIKLGTDMCRALEQCKKHCIIHRDIKPENMFISELGDFKLGDFGVARTAERTTGGLSKKGTYNYMAPEVYKGERYGPSVDIYSLGIVLYKFCNNNRSPFLPAYPAPISFGDRENAFTKRMTSEAMPAPVNANEPLAGIILKACAYDPKDRYANPTEMRKALEAVAKRSAETAAEETVIVENDYDETERMFVAEETVFMVNPHVVKTEPEERTEKAEILMVETVKSGLYDDETVTVRNSDIAEQTVPDAVAAECALHSEETAPAVGAVGAFKAERPADEPPAKNAGKPSEDKKLLLHGKAKTAVIVGLIALSAIILILIFSKNGSEQPPVITGSPTPTVMPTPTDTALLPGEDTSSSEKDDASENTPSGNQSVVPNQQKWSKWSKWGTDEIQPSDAREVETRTVYVYDLYRYNLNDFIIDKAVRLNMVSYVYQTLKDEQGYSTDEANAIVDPLYQCVKGKGSYQSAANAIAPYGFSLTYETKTVNELQPLNFTEGNEVTLSNGETWFSATGAEDGTVLQYRSRTRN